MVEILTDYRQNNDEGMVNMQAFPNPAHESFSWSITQITRDCIACSDTSDTKVDQLRLEISTQGGAIIYTQKNK
jgi:hypothetical protein